MKKLKDVLKKVVQRILMAVFEFLHPLAIQKIVLFSEFMAMKNEPLLLTKKGNERYLVMPGDFGISRKLYIGHHMEHLKAVRAIQLIEKYKQKIEVVYDIGANVGQVLVPLIKQGYIKNAVAIEPEPKNMRICKANCIINGVDENVVFYQIALGAKENEVLRFELSDNNSGDHRVRVTEEDGMYSEINRKCMLVSSTALDSFFPTDGKTDKILLWIDVQGWEGNVLEGAQKFLQNRTPIGFEFWPYGLKRSGSFDLLIKNISCYGNLYEISDCHNRQISIDDMRKAYKEYEGGGYFDVVAF